MRNLEHHLQCARKRLGRRRGADPIGECQNPDFSQLASPDDEGSSVFVLEVAADTFLNIRSKWMQGNPHPDSPQMRMTTCSVSAPAMTYPRIGSMMGRSAIALAIRPRTLLQRACATSSLLHSII